MTKKEELIIDFLKNTEVLADILLDSENKDCVISRTGKCIDCNQCINLYGNCCGCQDRVVKYLEEKS